MLVFIPPSVVVLGGLIGGVVGAIIVEAYLVVFIVAGLIYAATHKT